MPQNISLNFTLFKNDLKNKKQSLSDITWALERNQFTHLQLLELIHKAPDTHKKSLFIIYFLGKIPQDELISKIVHHIQSIHPHHPMWQIQHEEDCLILAINRSFNNPKKTTYLTYINLLTDKLLNQNHVFSKHALHLMVRLMIKKGLDIPVKKALFTSLFAHQNQILYCNLVQFIGLQGGDAQYEQVIFLCEWALKKLNPQKNQAAIVNLQTALSEACLELELSQNTGFLSGLRGFFKRCWTYGWTGFFKPNTPIYVKCASNELTIEIQGNTINQHLCDSFGSRQFDDYIETVLRYTDDQQLDNWAILNQNESTADRFQLLNILLDKEFYTEIDNFFKPEPSSLTVNHKPMQQQRATKPKLSTDLSGEYSDSPYDDLNNFLKTPEDPPQGLTYQHAQDFMNSATGFVGYMFTALEKVVDDTTEVSTRLLFTSTAIEDNSCSKLPN